MGVHTLTLLVLLGVWNSLPQLWLHEQDIFYYDQICSSNIPCPSQFEPAVICNHQYAIWYRLFWLLFGVWIFLTGTRLNISSHSFCYLLRTFSVKMSFQWKSIEKILWNPIGGQSLSEPCELKAQKSHCYNVLKSAFCKYFYLYSGGCKVKVEVSITLIRFF